MNKPISFKPILGGTFVACLLFALASYSQTNTYNTLDKGTTATGIQTATSVVNCSSATAPSSGQVLTATSSTACNWQTPASSSSWSSLTAPTSNNSVTATVDTSQTLLGHFDTSASASVSLFSFGEDAATTKTGASNVLRTRVLNITTLSGSLAHPLVVSAYGYAGSGVNPGNLSLDSLGNFRFIGNTDAVTSSGGTSATLQGGASASANSSGNVNLTGGNNSSSGNGGNVVLTAGTSSSGTAGTVQAVGAFSVTLQTIDKSYVVSTPTTGQTVTIATGQKTAIINPAGTLATLTVTLPGCTAAYDGSESRFSSTQAITALTVNATSGSVADAPTTLALGSGNAYICVGSSTTWYRLN